MRMRAFGLIALVFIALLWLSSCGGGGDRGTVVNPGIGEIAQINAAIHSAGADWQAGENNVTMMSATQRKSLNGLITEATSTPRIAMRNALDGSQLPATLDWRDKDGVNWMTGIKDQGYCGSCVAFASVGTVEALKRINNINPITDVDLSESDLFSCGGASCGQGWQLSSAANRLMNTGVVDEACLPYQAQDNVCSGKCTNWQSRLLQIASWVPVPSDRTSIKNYLLQGPVVSGIEVYTDFYAYKSGIYQHVYGSSDGHHAIVIVGYNDPGGYWIVRNSWSSGWGEAGYVRIKYGEVGIETHVLAMQMSGNPAGVAATVNQTSVTLSGGQAQVTLTCATNGSVTTIEGRCDTTGTWATITSGSTRNCTYTSAATYTPGCRVNGVVTDNVDSPVTVNAPSNVTVAASVAPTSGNTSTVFTVTCTVSGGTATSLEHRCDTTGALWYPISSGNHGECEYGTPGTYSPGCRVNGSTVNNVATPITVTAVPNITVVASVSPTSGTTSGTYTLTCDVSGGTATSIEGRCGISDSWSSISTGNTKTCTYTNAGTYTPGCRVNGTTFNNVNTSVTVSTPSNQPPTASASANPTSGTGPLTVQFTGGCTDTDGTCVAYSWSFGDSSPTSSTQNPSHTFSSSGTYNSTLTVTDNNGATAQAQVTIVVNAAAPMSHTIAAGSRHSCAVTTSGGVKCWGWNNYGQLGDGTTTERHAPVDVTLLTASVNAVTAGGVGHTCVIISGGGVKCWGVNDNGQLGDGTTTNRNNLVSVVGLTSGVTAISAGEQYTCALTTGGGIKCWGGNSAGQLGDGTTTPRTTPVDVWGLSSGVIAITTGSKHACALTSGGGVKCWGNNDHGQLGNGSTTTSRTTPADVSGLTSGVIAIAGGYYHTCAVTNSGGVKCWGNNNHGILGDGTTTNQLTPVDVLGLASGVRAIAAGIYHTCALTTTGGVLCWGYNNCGQLGIDSAGSGPADVSGLTSGVSSITAGDYHSCALTSTGVAKCWGWNNYGQLGDGTTTDRFTPVTVTGF